MLITALNIIWVFLFFLPHYLICVLLCSCILFSFNLEFSPHHFCQMLLTICACQKKKKKTLFPSWWKKDEIIFCIKQFFIHLFFLFFFSFSKSNYSENHQTVRKLTPFSFSVFFPRFFLFLFETINSAATN